jgi:hypothetical protein
MQKAEGESELDFDLTQHKESIRAAVTSTKLKPVAGCYAVDGPAPTNSTNSKIVHFVRHGQGYHNEAADQVLFARIYF